MQCPTHKKKLTAIDEDDKTRKCDVCSRPPKLKCASCKFLLCSNCRICPAKHFLLKIVDLNVNLTIFRKHVPAIIATAITVILVNRTTLLTMMEYGTAVNVSSMSVRNVLIECLVLI